MNSVVWIVDNVLAPKNETKATALWGAGLLKCGTYVTQRAYVNRWRNELAVPAWYSRAGCWVPWGRHCDWKTVFCASSRDLAQVCQINPGSRNGRCAAGKSRQSQIAR